MRSFLVDISACRAFAAFVLIAAFGAADLAAQPQKPGTPRGAAKPARQELFPGTRSSAEVLAHIKATVDDFHLDEDLNLPELAMRQNELQIQRILKVRSERTPPEYVVIELSDVTGKVVAVLGFRTNGTFMMARDCRKCEDFPLDLSDAASRVQGKRGRAPIKAEHVYFNNPAEGGYSRLRPLTAVTTERGAIYFNSRGEAFAEEGSDILSDFAGVAVARWSGPEGVKRLHSLGRW